MLWAKLLIVIFFLELAASAANITLKQNENIQQTNLSTSTISTNYPTITYASTTEEPKQSSTQRRLITYDQRQEGQYNIRADLDNFMIVLVPSSPNAGVNLLDLLTRKSLKRSNLKKTIIGVEHPETNSIGKLPGPIKNAQERFDYLNKIQNQHIPSYIDTVIPYSEYVEGRTPYKVDISDNDKDIIRLHQEQKQQQQQQQQIDVLPPPYPLHLMKPHHLDIIDQVIPNTPPPVHQGKLREFFRYFGNDRHAKSFHNGIQYLKGLNTNNMLIIGDGRPFDYYNSISGINNNNNDDQFSSISHIDSLDLSSSYNTGRAETGSNANWELKLIGATEQCGPDRARDSYGVCQFVS